MKRLTTVTVMIGAIALVVTAAWGWFIYSTAAMVLR